MKNILIEICNKKKEEIRKSKERCSFSSFEKILKDKRNRNFKELLINSSKKNKNNIIAEIKKASPSAGTLINDYNPDNIATEYEKSGVGAISILTEKNYFQGELDHLSLINSKINIPILRKDFIIDKYQILESKAYKADAILLILSILNDNEVKEFGIYQ